jgi:hypothetical protein
MFELVKSVEPSRQLGICRRSPLTPPAASVPPASLRSARLTASARRRTAPPAPARSTSRARMDQTEHAGDRRSNLHDRPVPFDVVHFGTIALVPHDERIPVRDWRARDRVIQVEGYLVETQSLQGLSGASVFARPSVPMSLSPSNMLIDPRYQMSQAMYSRPPDKAWYFSVCGKDRRTRRPRRSSVLAMACAFRLEWASSFRQRKSSKRPTYKG